MLPHNAVHLGLLTLVCRESWLGEASEVTQAYFLSKQMEKLMSMMAHQ